MKLLIAAFVMQAALGAAISSQRHESKDEAPVNSSVLLAQETPPIVTLGCTGSKPCCEPSETGACSKWMICFGGLWTCP